MTEVVPNQAYDAWNVKSLLFIPVFLFSEDYVRKGVLHDLKEIRSEERIAFGNSLSEKRRESGLSQEELDRSLAKVLMQYPDMRMRRTLWMYILLQRQ